MPGLEFQAFSESRAGYCLLGAIVYSKPIPLFPGIEKLIPKFGRKLDLENNFC